MEIVNQSEKEPVPLSRIWPDHESYPWGPHGENQSGLRIKNRAMRFAEKNAKQEILPYSELVSIETHISPERVQHYIDNPSTELPFAYRHNGRVVLWDGTHRVSARLKSGFTGGPVLVADLDDILTPDGQVRHPDQFG